MLIEKILKISLEEQEKEKILEVSAMFNEICDNCNDCEECPILDLCNTSGTYPHIALQELVKKC